MNAEAIDPRYFSASALTSRAYRLPTVIEKLLEDRGLEPLTSCMPCKRKNRRKSVISNESRRLSHPINTRIGDILQGW